MRQITVGSLCIFDAGDDARERCVTRPAMCGWNDVNVRVWIYDLTTLFVLSSPEKSRVVDGDSVTVFSFEHNAILRVTADSLTVI